VKLVEEPNLLKCVYSGNYMSCEPLGKIDNGHELYEVKKKPAIIHYKFPIHIGAHIVNESKKLILELVYEVIKPNFLDDSFQFFATTTDSVSLWEFLSPRSQTGSRIVSSPEEERLSRQ
jgi:hypothetical protein